MKEITIDWFLRHLAAFAESYPDWTLDTEGARHKLAQHLFGNLAMVLIEERNTATAKSAMLIVAAQFAMAFNHDPEMETERYKILKAAVEYTTGE